MDLFLLLPITYKSTMKVECKIFSPNKSVARHLTLIIDTGASSTAISRSRIEALGYTDITKGAVPMRTAGGLMHLDTTILSRLDFGGEFTISNLEVNILDWEDTSIHGVIGMDILSKLHLHSNTKTLAIQTKPFSFKESACS